MNLAGNLFGGRILATCDTTGTEDRQTNFVLGVQEVDHGLRTCRQARVYSRSISKVFRNEDFYLRYTMRDIGRQNLKGFGRRHLLPFWLVQEKKKGL